MEGQTKAGQGRMMEHRGRGEMADVDDILAALKRQPSRVRGGHSPVYLWLWQHHEHLKGELTLPRRMDWSALAGELGRRGIMDGNGKPPTAERTRKAWWQVGRDKEAVTAGTFQRRRKAKQVQAAPSPPASAGPGGEGGQLPPGIKLVEPDPPKGRYQFRLAGGIKKWTKDNPAPD